MKNKLIIVSDSSLVKSPVCSRNAKDWQNCDKFEHSSVRTIAGVVIVVLLFCGAVLQMPDCVACALNNFFLTCYNIRKIIINTTTLQVS